MPECTISVHLNTCLTSYVSHVFKVTEITVLIHSYRFLVDSKIEQQYQVEFFLAFIKCFMFVYLFLYLQLYIKSFLDR